MGQEGQPGGGAQQRQQNTEGVQQRLQEALRMGDVGFQRRQSVVLMGNAQTVIEVESADFMGEKRSVEISTARYQARNLSYNNLRLFAYSFLELKVAVQAGLRKNHPPPNRARARLHKLPQPWGCGAPT